MSEFKEGRNEVLLEVLEKELDFLTMLRRRAKDDALKALVIAEREVEIKAELEELKTGEAA